jgi:hypothetical protein
MENPSNAAFEQGHKLQFEIPSYGKYKVDLMLTDVHNGTSCLLTAHQCCLLDVNQGHHSYCTNFEYKVLVYTKL